MLIQSASGGVGLAAIQVCRIIGAEVNHIRFRVEYMLTIVQAYCTVEVTSQVEYLIELGVPEDRIFYLQDPSLVRNIHKATYGRGADIVLNTSGDCFHTSWQCVARFAIMIDLAKYSRTERPASPVNENRMFAAVDLGQISQQRPEIIQG